jgi:hypothetical protein
MRWMEHVACMGEIRSVYKVFLTKRSLEQLQCRQSNNFEVYCEDTEWEVAECIWLRGWWWAYVHAVQKLQVCKRLGIFLLAK